MTGYSRDLNLSVIIITLNEGKRLNACLQSLPPGCEIIVLDSGSSDKTKEIALSFGAHVSERSFTNYSEQKNAALALTTRDWVLSVDADETLDRALQESIINLLKNHKAPEHTGFYLRRRLVFMGRLMRFGKTTDFPLRLFKRGAGHFQSDIHETVTLSHGSVGQLDGGELLHYSYDDLTDYFSRFNRYTTEIAKQHIKNGRRTPKLAWLVFRPIGDFMSRYILRLGFLDGYPGYCYALLSSLYAFVKYAKLKEMKERS